MFLRAFTRLLRTYAREDAGLKMIWGKTVRAPRTGGHLLTGRRRKSDQVELKVERAACRVGLALVKQGGDELLPSSKIICTTREE